MKCPRKLLATVLALGLSAAAITLLRAQQGPDQVPSLQRPGSQAGPQTPSSRPPADSQEQDPRAKIVNRVTLVVVPVTVKNGAGELVTDLQQNDFRVFEDGIEQPIEVFSDDALPLSAAILIDDDLKQSTAEKSSEDVGNAGGGIQRFR